MDKRCLKHDLDITVDTWKYLFYFKLSQNIFVPWVYVKIKQCESAHRRSSLQRSAKVGAPGLVNFIYAVAYHICPSLPAASTLELDSRAMHK